MIAIVYPQIIRQNLKNDPRVVENSRLMSVLSGKIGLVFDNLEAKKGDRRKAPCKSFRSDSLGRATFLWTLKYLVH